MMKFTVLVIASVLASGLDAAAVEIANFPHFFPELLPIEIAPEVEQPNIVPGGEPFNPCNACFEYMTALIDQLTEVAVPENPVRPLPEGVLPEDIRPLPIPEQPGQGVRPLPEGVLPEDLRPLPVPEQPEVEVNPIPIPILPEVEVRPLPVPIAPEVEIRPIPFPVIGPAQ